MAAGPRPVTPVSILAAKLADLVERWDGSDPELGAELHAAAQLAAGLDDYVSRWTTPQSDDLRRLARCTAEQDWTALSGGRLEQEMLSGHVEGELLKMLVHATRATRVLEIGMFTGYSALAMAEALPPDGRVIACEIDAEVAAFAQRCFDESEHGRKIDVRVGPALDTLAQLAGTTFDLVFLDADKAGYVDYMVTVLETGLLAPHGLLCVDNTLLQGEPWTPGERSANGTAIAAFNAAVAAYPRVEQVLVPMRDGLTLIRQVDTP